MSEATPQEMAIRLAAYLRPKYPDALIETGEWTDHAGEVIQCISLSWPPGTSIEFMREKNRQVFEDEGAFWMSVDYPDDALCRYVSCSVGIKERV